MTLSLERLEDLSVIYLVNNLFSTVNGINIVDEFPQTDLVIPTISITQGKIRLEDFELGNRLGRRYRRWYIDVFALNKAQRDEIGYKILNGFPNGITVYNYNLGFPPAVVASVEHLDVQQRELDFIKIIPELVDKLYWRCTVSIFATNDTV